MLAEVRLGVMAVTTVLLALAWSARAQAGEAGVRLEYVRGPGAERCPGEPELRAAVAARTGNDPFVARDALGGGASVSCRVAREGAGLRAEIVWTDAGGEARRRVMTSASADCAGLAQAVVLTLALVVAPTPDQAAWAGGPGPVSAAAPPAQPDDAPARTASAGTPITSAISAETPPEAALVAHPAPPASRWGAVAGVHGGLLPGAAAGVALVTTRGLAPSWWLEASVGAAAGGDALVPGAALGSLGLCRGATLAACAGAGAALFVVEGAGLFEAPSARVGAGVRWRRGRLVAGVDAAATLARVRVHDPAGEVAFTAPPFSVFGYLGLTWAAR